MQCQNYHTVKQFPECLLAKELRKVEVKRREPVYLGLSILEINKALMHEFCYDYINIKYQNNAKLRCMDTDSFMVHIQTEDVYKNTEDNVRKRFDMLNYTIKRPLPKGKKEKVIRLMKDGLSRKIKDKICRDQAKNIFLHNG